MVKMNFNDPVLEKIIRRWKWGRNNSILLFEEAVNKNILDFSSKTDKKISYTFQPILHQFQCLVATTDAYYRKLTNAKNQNYGILVIGDQVINKDVVTIEMIKKYLVDQMVMLENLLKSFTYSDVDKNIRPILTISDHEYLHQGELILMFREAGIDLPERFKTAWAL